jgi:hypothetical protein
MMWTPEQQATYYSAVIEEQVGHCSAIEQRCEHLETIVNSTISLVKLAIKDFQSPYLRPILGPLMGRLNSIVAFMETALKNAPNPEEW